ncbi:hypothetical protein DFH08DRAFT_1029145 [Mycena albidolilacea]|uniref:Uncharacterized protein n=1 Tax=Mycena albidolilacea TaxID=1033008 RepID=A0AAD7EHG0_9AGAR|nr:hypothetical protein DFH08DRAFT_1029145 [Mycena albidolilacea]
MPELESCAVKELPLSLLGVTGAGSSTCDVLSLSDPYAATVSTAKPAARSHSIVSALGGKDSQKKEKKHVLALTISTACVIPASAWNIVSAKNSFSLHLNACLLIRAPRTTWRSLHMMTSSVMSIIFCMSLSNSDQVLTEEHGQFHTSIILFFTEINVFKVKIHKIPLERHFPEYIGGPDINKATKFILWRFMQENRTRLSVYPQLHFFFLLACTNLTRANETQNVCLIFAAVKETILQNAIKDSRILDTQYVWELHSKRYWNNLQWSEECLGSERGVGGASVYDPTSELECPTCHQMIHAGTAGEANLESHKPACKGPPKGVMRMLSCSNHHDQTAPVHRLAPPTQPAPHLCAEGVLTHFEPLPAHYSRLAALLDSALATLILIRDSAPPTAPPAFTGHMTEVLRALCRHAPGWAPDSAPDTTPILPPSPSATTTPTKPPHLVFHLDLSPVAFTPTVPPSPTQLFFDITKKSIIGDLQLAGIRWTPRGNLTFAFLHGEKFTAEEARKQAPAIWNLIRPLLKQRKPSHCPRVDGGDSWHNVVIHGVPVHVMPPNASNGFATPQESATVDIHD